MLFLTFSVEKISTISPNIKYIYFDNFLRNLPDKNQCTCNVADCVDIVAATATTTSSSVDFDVISCAFISRRHFFSKIHLFSFFLLFAVIKQVTRHFCHTILAQIFYIQEFSSTNLHAKKEIGQLGCLALRYLIIAIFAAQNEEMKDEFNFDDTLKIN